MDAGTGGGGGPAACQLTQCFTGAPSRGGSNQPFDDICDDPIVQGVVQDCSSGGCFNTFNTFLQSTATLYQPLFQALDTNHDGAVDANDTDCAVTLLGYSWGGVGRSTWRGSSRRTRASTRRVVMSRASSRSTPSSRS